MKLTNYIKNVPNFPIEGIQFKDITPLLADGKAFDHACSQMAEFVKEQGATIVLGPESRGFIFGCVVANKCGLGFVPVRKPGKLPRETIKFEYALEYGTNTLEMHKDAVKEGDKVVIVDDLLATGGTIEAIVKMAKMQNAEVVGVTTLIELKDLKGRELLNDIPVFSLLQY